jgi:hypothetical protein
MPVELSVYTVACDESNKVGYAKARISLHLLTVVLFFICNYSAFDMPSMIEFFPHSANKLFAFVVTRIIELAYEESFLYVLRSSSLFIVQLKQYLK